MHSGQEQPSCGKLFQTREAGYGQLTSTDRIQSLYCLLTAVNVCVHMSQFCVCHHRQAHSKQLKFLSYLQGQPLLEQLRFECPAKGLNSGTTCWNALHSPCATWFCLMNSLRTLMFLSKHWRAWARRSFTGSLAHRANTARYSRGRDNFTSARCSFWAKICLTW